MAGVTELWRRIAQWMAEPQHLAVLASAGLAFLVVANRPLWRLCRTVITIAHEGGHALVALAARRRLAGIRLHPDTSGVMVSSGPGRGAGVVLTLLAGYPTPSLLGLGGAALVAAGDTRAALWVAGALLVATLVAVRNPYGVLAVLVTTALIVAVGWYLPVAGQAAFVAGLAWFLLLGGLRAAHELRTARHARWPSGSDADQLAQLTGVPAGAWIALFVLVGLATLGLGGWLMLLR
jgi:hypothetical protein